MHFISTLILCLLAGGVYSQTTTDSNNATKNTNATVLGHKVYFEYRTILLNGNFTILDEFNHDVMSPGTGPSTDIIELKPNKAHQWNFERITGKTHIVRDSNSSKYIHFPELKDGAVATLSETSATLFEVTAAPNAVFNVTASDANPKGVLTWTVEAFSTRDRRPVLKLREPAPGAHRQEFIMALAPKMG